LVLAIFSIVSWAIIVSKWRRFSVIQEEEKRFLRAYELRSHDYEDLRIQAQDLKSSPSAAVFLGLLDRVSPSQDLYESQTRIGNGGTPISSDRRYLEKVSQYIIQTQLSHQEAYLPFLATTGNSTPFIGLLGTVLGIITAFNEIGVKGSASLAVVAPGVAEALVATAAGLFAAIPAVIAYNFFLTRIRKFVFQVEVFTVELLNAFEELNREASEVEVTR
jgi:biopolymer transport protein TolQ